MVPSKRAITFSELSEKAASLSGSSNPRCHALHLGACVGNLCGKLLAYAPPDPNRVNDVSTNFPPTCTNETFWSTHSLEREEIYVALGDVFFSVCKYSNICGIDLRESILKKMQLNARKYPVHLCKGKSGKYTEYTEHTGIDRDNQSTLDISVEEDDVMKNNSSCSESPKSVTESLPNNIDSVPDLMKKIRDFAMERQWSRFHTPRNLCLAMMGEAGECAELFQWMGDGQECTGHGLSGYGWKEEDIDKVQQELADVSIYALRLADVIGMEDLGAYAMSS